MTRLYLEKFVWDWEDYLNEVLKQFPDAEVYEEVANNSSTLESTIFTVPNKISGGGDLSAGNLEYFFSIRFLNFLNFSIKFLNVLNFICYHKFIKHFVISILPIATYSQDMSDHTINI